VASMVCGMAAEEAKSAGQLSVVLSSVHNRAEQSLLKRCDRPRLDAVP
jgi:hypothetical protein